MPKELPVRIYSPEPLLGHPVTMLKNLGKDLWAGRELAWQLFMRDLQAQFRQTFLGYLWLILPPLFAAIPFIFLSRQGIVRVDTGGVPYPAFAMMGTLLWQVFVDAINSPGKAVSKAKPMLAKINFPREAILVGGLYMVVFNLLIRICMVALVMVWFKVTPSATLAFFPVAMAALLLCGFCIGLLLVPVSGLYNDVTRALPMITSFWMLLTPVIYPPKSEGTLALLATWNPVSPLIVTARESLSGQTLSMLPEFQIVFGASAALTLIGILAYRLAMPHLIVRMGG